MDNGSVAAANSAYDLPMSTPARPTRYRSKKKLAKIAFKLAQFLARPFKDPIANMARQAIFLSLADIFGRARENYALWPLLNERVVAAFPDHLRVIKARYRRLIAEEARWYYRHNQIVYRVDILVVTTTLLTFATTLILFALRVPRGGYFVIESIIIVAIVGIVALYSIVDSGFNLRRGMAIGFGILLIGIIASTLPGGGRWLESDTALTQAGLTLTMLGVLFLGTGVVGAILERPALKLWVRFHAAETATVLSIQLLAEIDEEPLGLVGSNLTYARLRLRQIASCIEVGLSSGDATYSQRTQEAAKIVRECAKRGCSSSNLEQGEVSRT